MAKTDDTRTCSIDRCDHPVHCRGWCKQHYARVVNTGTPYRPCEGCGNELPIGTNGKQYLCGSCRVCSVDGCDKPRKAYGVCNSHASRISRNGTTDVFCRNCGDVVPFRGFVADQGADAHYCSDSCRPVCSIPGCGDLTVGLGFCKAHWNRFNETGNPYRPCRGCGAPLSIHLDGRVAYCGIHCKPLCGAPDCGELADDNGYCTRHGSRARYHGGMLPVLDYECSLCGTLVERSYADKQQRTNSTLCPDCRLKRSRDHGWYRAEVLAGLIPADCGLCGEHIDLDLHWPDSGSLQIDHIIPVSRGGSNERRNLQPAHAKCNMRKNNRIAPPIEGILTLF